MVLSDRDRADGDADVLVLMGVNENAIELPKRAAREMKMRRGCIFAILASIDYASGYIYRMKTVNMLYGRSEYLWLMVFGFVRSLSGDWFAA